MSSAAASYASGSANAAAQQNNAEGQMFSSQLNAYANGPRKESLPMIDNTYGNLYSGFNNRGSFIGSAGGNQYFNNALSQLGAQSGAVEQLQRLNPSISANDINQYASQLYDGGAVDAFRQAQYRDLQENQLTGINAADAATGNLGSSRNAVQQAIAQRGADDRVGQFQAQMQTDALNRAQQQLGTNQAQQMAQIQQLYGMDQDYMSQLVNAGQLQQQLDQIGADNAIGARDWNVTNQAQLAELLGNYAALGNLTSTRQGQIVEGGERFSMKDLNTGIDSLLKVKKYF